MKFVGSTPIRPIGWWRDIKVDLIGPLLHFPGIYNIGGGKKEGEEYDRERSFPLESSSSLEALFSLDFLEGTEGTFPPSNPPSLPLP